MYYYSLLPKCTNFQCYELKCAIGWMVPAAPACGACESAVRYDCEVRLSHVSCTQLSSYDYCTIHQVQSQFTFRVL